MHKKLKLLIATIGLASFLIMPAFASAQTGGLSPDPETTPTASERQATPRAGGETGGATPRAAGGGGGGADSTYNPKDSLCSGVNIDVTEASNDCKKGGPEDSTNTLIARIINLLSVIVGIIAVIMIIISGFRFVTAGGDSGTITSARNGILFAIVGLIIVAFAQIIVKFVLKRVTEA